MAPLRTRPTRTRRDRCPGVLRPWPAADGGLVRVRLVGGRISSTSLVALSGVAEEYGDGDLHLTARANLQLRALPLDSGSLPTPVVAAIEDTGPLPSRPHEPPDGPIVGAPRNAPVGVDADDTEPDPG